MLNERLPVHIEPRRLAESRRILEGTYAVAEMPRLLASLSEEQGEIAVELQFGIDEEGIRYMRGRLRAELGLQCQRCLETMRYPLETELSLAIVSGEAEAEMLPEHYDPLFVDAEPLYLKDLIEDELLLALPIVPRHPEGECGIESGNSGDDEEVGEPEQKDNPFSVLASMKTSGKA